MLQHGYFLSKYYVPFRRAICSSVGLQTLLAGLFSPRCSRPWQLNPGRPA
jgi:hypothetical protein